jgi:hypothetical protein
MTATPNTTSATTIAGGGPPVAPPPEASSGLAPTSMVHRASSASVAMKSAQAQPTAGQRRVRRIPSVPADSRAPLRANATITAIRNASPSSRPIPSQTLASSPPNAATTPSDSACPPTSPSTTAASATGGFQRAIRRREAGGALSVLEDTRAAEAAMAPGIPG